jgi:hypothetical protein
LIRRRNPRQSKLGGAKPLGKLDHAAGADPVGSFFVLLHLLKRDPRRRAELGLAQAHFQAPATQPFADTLVEVIGRLHRHCSLGCVCKSFLAEDVVGFDAEARVLEGWPVLALSAYAEIPSNFAAQKPA